MVGTANLDVGGALHSPAFFDPGIWQFEMDSTRIDLGDGPVKLQGVPLGKVLASMEPQARATRVILQTSEAPLSLNLAEVLSDDDLRLFTVIGETGVTTALARMDGVVLATEVTSIEVR